MADAVAPRPARRAKPARSALCDRSNGTGEEQLASAAQQVQPADDAMTTAEHAARLSLPRISAETMPLSTRRRASTISVGPQPERRPIRCRRFGSGR